jgi:hypothetical protein
MGCASTIAGQVCWNQRVWAEHGHLPPAPETSNGHNRVDEGVLSLVGVQAHPDPRGGEGRASETASKRSGAYQRVA